MSSSFHLNNREATNAQSHGGWQCTALQGNTDVPWSEARPDSDFPTTPGEDVSENNILSLPDTPPRRNHLGSRNEEPLHLHAGSGLLHAKNCAPVWCRSPRTKKLDVALKNSLRTVSGSLRATPVNHLPILSGIAPAALRREAAVLALSRKAERDADHFSTRQSASLLSVLD